MVEFGQVPAPPVRRADRTPAKLAQEVALWLGGGTAALGVWVYWLTYAFGPA